MLKAILEQAKTLPVATLLVESGLAQSDSFEELRCRVSSALQNQCRVEENDADCYCWIQNMYPSNVVYSMDGKYFQRTYTVDAQDNVTFGAANEVEMSWSPVADSSVTESAGTKVPHKRVMVSSLQQITEGYNSKTGELTMTIIRPGFNLSKSRYYPGDMLKRDCKIFEGAKMFVNHATDEEMRKRPEGDVNQWVASVKKVWAESDGTIKGIAPVIDPPFRAKLDTLAEKGLLTEMGVSIRAIGESDSRSVDGVNTDYVESLHRCRSVDFVTYAGAGGQVEAIEAASGDGDVDLVTEAQFRERRPDLIEIIESKKEQDMAKSLEQQIQEANAATLAEKTRADKAEAKLQESEKVGKKATAAAELTKLLSESNLPEKAQERVRKQFSEAEDVKGMAEAIVAEHAYLKDIGVKIEAPKTKVKNLGAKDSVEESVGEKKPVNLEESFSAFLSPEEAKLAASMK
jgi:hypothetical protein